MRVVFDDGTVMYEERITLWKARDFEEAIAKAEQELDEYCDSSTFVNCGIYQCFQLFETPESGAEVFSLMRRSALSSDEYVTRFFETGDEREEGI
ncbi:hypothetical protein GCM10009638_06200 [Luteococcus sanguinis]